MASKTMCDGTIDTGEIYDVHQQIKDVVSKYTEINNKVNSITKDVKANWVGKGRNAFEAEYKALISKIEDFGDTLTDIYDALVEAEAEYESADNQISQDFKNAMK